MRKLKIMEHISLDGVIQSSGENNFPYSDGSDSWPKAPSSPMADGLRHPPEMKLHYCCTVISVPACVVKPLYIAIVGWSPLASEGGTTTLN